jgi:histidine ammonia-lyase
VVAVELLCGAQAIDFHRALSPGRGTAAAHAAVRASVPFVESDTSLSPYLAVLETEAASGRILAAIEDAVGELLPRTPA